MLGSDGLAEGGVESTWVGVGEGLWLGSVEGVEVVDGSGVGAGADADETIAADGDEPDGVPPADRVGPTISPPAAARPRSTRIGKAPRMALRRGRGGAMSRAR